MRSDEWQSEEPEFLLQRNSRRPVLAITLSDRLVFQCSGETRGTLSIIGRTFDQVHRQVVA